MLDIGGLSVWREGVCNGDVVSGKPYQDILNLSPSLFIPSIEDALNESLLFTDFAGTNPATSIGDVIKSVKDASANGFLILSEEDGYLGAGNTKLLQDVDGKYYLELGNTVSGSSNLYITSDKVVMAGSCVYSGVVRSVQQGYAGMISRFDDNVPGNGYYAITSTDGTGQMYRQLTTAFMPANNNLWKNRVKSAGVSLNTKEVLSSDCSYLDVGVEHSLAGLRIGQLTNHTNLTTGLDIYALAIFPQILTQIEREMVEDYMASAMGIIL